MNLRLINAVLLFASIPATAATVNSNVQQDGLLSKNIGLKELALGNNFVNIKKSVKLKCTPTMSAWVPKPGDDKAIEQIRRRIHSLNNEGNYFCAVPDLKYFGRAKLIEPSVSLKEGFCRAFTSRLPASKTTSRRSPATNCST